MRNVYQALDGKSEGKKALGWLRRKWEHNNKMNVKEVGWSGADWSHLAQEWNQWQVVVNTVMKLWVP
jgi:hypothetical protein